MTFDAFYVFAATIMLDVGLSIGMALHALEDSLTVSGVKWRYGKNFTRHGHIRTSRPIEEILAGALMLLGRVIILIQFTVKSDLLLRKRNFPQ